MAQAALTLGGQTLSFPVLNYTEAPTTTNTGSASTGAGAAKVHVHDINITKSIDKSSPKLALACATGKHFPTATITVRKAAKGSKVEYLTYKLTDVIISSVTASNTNEKSTCRARACRSNFSKVEVTYTQQKP